MRHSMRTNVRLLCFLFFLFYSRPTHPPSLPRFSYSILQFISFSLSCVLLVCLSILFVCVSLLGRPRALSFSPTAVCFERLASRCSCLFSRRARGLRCARSPIVSLHRSLKNQQIRFKNSPSKNLQS